MGLLSLGGRSGGRAGPGRLRVVTGTDPAAGADVAEAVPAGTWWELATMLVSVVTDATATTRHFQLYLDDGTTDYYRIPAVNTQAASLTYVYKLAAGGGVNAFVNDGYQVPLPAPPLILGPGFRVKTSVINLQAGDNIGAPVLYVIEYTSEPT